MFTARVYRVHPRYFALCRCSCCSACKGLCGGCMFAFFDIMPAGATTEQPPTVLVVFWKCLSTVLGLFHSIYFT